MPVQDDLTTVRRQLDDLIHSLVIVEQQVGHSLDMRRCRADADHLRESLELLSSGMPAAARVPTTIGATARRGVAQAPVIQVPDVPYDPNLWRGAEDEGLGNQGRTSP